MPTGKNQWLQRNIWKLMPTRTGPESLGPRRQAHGLHGLGPRHEDADDLQGAAERLGPGVVDRWTWRSDGYFTKADSDEASMITRNIEGGVSLTPSSPPTGVGRSPTSIHPAGSRLLRTAGTSRATRGGATGRSIRCRPSTGSPPRSAGSRTGPHPEERRGRLAARHGARQHARVRLRRHRRGR